MASHAPLDKEGFLTNLEDWSEAVAESLAASQNLTLTADHWEILHLVRGYYDRYKVTPTSRVLGRIVSRELGKEKGRSIYLMQLFTSSSAREVARIAGLPKPANCH